MYSNIFYFRRICQIGGTEQFLYEIAKKYNGYDITIFYDEADPVQIKRLRKLVRCKKRRKGEKIQCERAFFNFNIDMIDDVEAKRYYFVSHAIYQELGYKPPIDHQKITDYIGVSEYSKDKLEEYGKIINKDIKPIRVYNPLTLEPKEKVIHLVSATRLDDRTKGGDRIKKMIKAMDEYAIKNDRHYLWLIFTNKYVADSPNVCVMRPRADVRPFIADSDYMVQLSNDMETYCYSLNEALGYGVPIVTTPLSVLDEFPITDDMCIKVNWDMSNVDDVVRKIFTRKRKRFVYDIPVDGWDDVLVHNPSSYDKDEKIRVRATDWYELKKITDKELGFIPKKGYEWEIGLDRWEDIEEWEHRTNHKLVERIDEPKRNQ